MNGLHPAHAILVPNFVDHHFDAVVVPEEEYFGFVVVDRVYSASNAAISSLPIVPQALVMTTFMPA